jgi:hypothetical protein
MTLEQEVNFLSERFNSLNNAALNTPAEEVSVILKFLQEAEPVMVKLQAKVNELKAQS